MIHLLYFQVPQSSHSTVRRAHDPNNDRRQRDATIVHHDFGDSVRPSRHARLVSNSLLMILRSLSKISAFRKQVFHTLFLFIKLTFEA